MSTLFALFLSVATVEYFRRLPFEEEVKRVLVVCQKALSVLMERRISDHWKERVLLCYAAAVMKSTLFLGLMLTGLFAGVGFGAYGLDRLFDPQPSTMELLLSPLGWLWMSLIGVGYLYGVNRFAVKSKGSACAGDYSFGDRMLHRLALGNAFIPQISLEIDQLFCRTKRAVVEEPPVFISGLARAGTTILMRTFYSTGQFRSLTYRDMPFVLMPCIWKALSSSFRLLDEASERAHGDGIMVDFDSPEAFEEVFWKAVTTDEYLFLDHLSPYSVSAEVLQQFRRFVKRIVSSADHPEQGRYLSKNNNNILRLGAIREAFPDALIIVPFRDPVQQAISLWQQHAWFSDLHAKDSFSRQYMQWLGHHEFGGTHRPFQFDDRLALPALNHDTLDPENINYWLMAWTNAYGYLLERAPEGTVFVSFDELCRTPQEVIEKLFSKADLAGDHASYAYLADAIHPPKVMNLGGIDHELKKQALQLYADLSEKAREPFNPHSLSGEAC